MTDLSLAPSGPHIFSSSNRFSELRPTKVYDSLWRFAAERQAIFFRRLSGSSAPWTKDPILQRHKFTNVYRASDRVSQFLIKEVLYNPDYSSDKREIVFRTILFKLFNKIETWKLLKAKIGPPSWETFDLLHYDHVLTAARTRGQRLYSAAYIIPPVRLEGSDGIKHRGHLRLLELIMRESLPEKLVDARSLRKLFMLLKTVPSFGDFLAFQLAIDLNYSDIMDHDENEFVVAGPGASDGISKCFENATSFTLEDIIEFVQSRQEVEFDRLDIDFQSLGGRTLHLIDCQNLFCEVSKYARVAHPEIAGVLGRKRIKQFFRPTALPMAVWYPPKWGINDLLPAGGAPTEGDLFASGDTG